MKKYKNFLTEKIEQNKRQYIETIISYLNKNTNYTYAGYNENFVVEKDNKKFETVLFLMVNLDDENEKKAIRFNFIGNDLYSIDMWEYFEFNLDDGMIYNKPSYEMRVPNSVLEVLDDIVAFVEGEFSVNENLTEEDVKESSEEKVESELQIWCNVETITNLNESKEFMAGCDISKLNLYKFASFKDGTLTKFNGFNILPFSIESVNLLNKIKSILR